MNKSGPGPAGFFGKLPNLGDFVSRRLPRSFIEAWDGWLESAIHASREQLAGRWLEIYLTSPVWRFVLSPGICGASGWAGVMIPSVDRVGRYYPLTLAMPLPGNPNLFLLLADDWFAGLDRLAVSALSDGFDFERFDAELTDYPAPPPAEMLGSDRAGVDGSPNSRFAARIAVTDRTPIVEAAVALNGKLLDASLHLPSYWGTDGSDHVTACLLGCDGLPPVDAYAALIAGEWDQRGWQLENLDLHNVPLMKTEAAPASAPSEPPDEGSNPTVSFGVTDVGGRRKINEDAFLDRAAIGLWAVADGMGGHRAGDVASRAIVDGLAGVGNAADLSGLAAQTEAVLQRVNGELRQFAGQDANGQLVGSTVVALLLRGERGIVLWAGDSRLYRMRDARLEQLTRDHSLADSLAEFGLLPENGAGGAAHCNVITRAVGAADELGLDRAEFRVLPGDRFLLCSDGIDKELSAEEIGEILSANGDARKAASRLLGLTLEKGARDNATALVVDVPRSEVARDLEEEEAVTVRQKRG